MVLIKVWMSVSVFQAFCRWPVYEWPGYGESVRQGVVVLAGVSLCCSVFLHSSIVYEMRASLIH